MRQRFNTRQRNYIILGLCSILLVMAAGYAAFRSQLTINGTSNITSDWKVLITDIQSNTLSGDATDAEAPSHTETTATFKTNLVSPGDSMQYTVTVENKGSIDAVLKTLSKTDSNNNAIIFEITGIEQGDTLKAHETTTFNVTVTYNRDVTTQPDNLTSDLTITLNYVQAGTTDTGTVLPSEANLIRSYSAGSQADYHNDAYREKITSIEFLNNKNIPSEAVQSWDVSERQDESVMAWIINDQENEGFYKLYIGGDGDVVANPNSSNLFNKFTQVKTINLTNFDTSNATNMANMFLNCYALSELDLSNFDTSNVTTMQGMFAGDRNLKSIKFGQSFDTSNVTKMGVMFNGCESLTELDVSHFNTSKAIDMNYMFGGLPNIHLDLRNFDTSKVTNMSSMFANSNFISLDLSSFDTSNVTSMTWMFSDASNLQTIYVGTKWSTAGTDTYLMFDGCGTDHVTLKSS